MRAKIHRRISGCFDTVMSGFEQSALSGNTALLKACRQHVFAFLHLCEWAQGDKSLAHYGRRQTVKNATESCSPAFAPKQPIIPKERMGKSPFMQSPLTQSPLTDTGKVATISLISLGEKVVKSVLIGSDTAILAYTKSICTLSTLLRDTKSFDKNTEPLLSAVKACLLTLEHIKELCCLTAYAVQVYALSDNQAQTQGKAGRTEQNIYQKMLHMDKKAVFHYAKTLGTLDGWKALLKIFGQDTDSTWTRNIPP